MLIRILGSAAGGGLPQWNCACPNCTAARRGDPVIERRSQSSVAVSTDGREWFLLNVSPDIPQQIADFPQLAPPLGCRRGTAIAGCLLTDAELDHTSGLLQLREGEPVPVHCTPAVARCLQDDFPLRRILGNYANPRWTVLDPGETYALADSRGEPSGLRVQFIELDGHCPRYVREEQGRSGALESGLLLEDCRTKARLVYAPGVAQLTSALEQAAREAACILLDGTFWSDDELARLEISDRTAQEMGHWPVGGANGSLAWFGRLPVKNRLYLHINNTNPMLRRGTAERELVERSGVRIAADGDFIEI